MRKKADNVDPDSLKVLSPGVSLGAMLQKYRIKEGLSQAELASLVETNRNTITNWENDKTQPDFGSIRALAIVLGIPLYEMFDLSSASVPTAHERQLITLYRELSEAGQETVDAMIRTVRHQEVLAYDRFLESHYLILPLISAPVETGRRKTKNTPEPVFVSKNSVSEKADSLLRISGSSTVYADGDLVYLKRSDTFEDGDDVACECAGEFVIRRAFKGKLYSLNAEGVSDDIPENEEFRILGEVIGKVRNEDLAPEKDKKELRGIFASELREF